MSTFEIKCLGTCAADFSPRLKTDLINKFDKDARRSSSVLLNNEYLIDCGYHTLNSLEIIGKNLSEIKGIFFTHLHDDHFQVQNVEKIAKSRKTPLDIWVREGADFPAVENTVVHYLTPTKTVEFDGMKITGLEANHDPRTFPQYLFFEKNGKTFLYATDGAWMQYFTFKFLSKKNVNLIMIDATVGNYNGDHRIAEHNSIPMIEMMLPSLKKIEAINDGTEIYLTHIAPSLHKPHDETVKIVEPMGLKVAYDGLEINC